jgi:hypothetical protein
MSNREGISVTQPLQIDYSIESFQLKGKQDDKVIDWIQEAKEKAKH